jgi:putative ubiquitin-RnfH superfamily antitoxin RatB of RatAB toxin-antitoxin module
MGERISVEVVFALRDQQKLVEVSLPVGASVADAISAARLQQDFEEIDFSALQKGIWGRSVSPDDPVNDGDRVEIYRPLERDPRDARRELARVQRLGSSS